MARRHHTSEEAAAPPDRAHASRSAVRSRPNGRHAALVCRLLYGTGMRLMEAVRLRVKDVDFEKRVITVRDGKGAKDRVTVLPDAALEPLHAHLTRRRELFDAESEGGPSFVYLPAALGRNTRTPAPMALAICVRARSYSIDPRSGNERRPSRREDDSAPIEGSCRKGRDRKPYRRIRCGTPSPRTCSNQATTSAPCRNCWAMQTSARR